MPNKASVNKTEVPAHAGNKHQKEIENHEAAAIHHDQAAMHHKDAAKHLEAGDTDEASASAIKALKEHFNAGEYQREDLKHNASENKSK